MKARIRITNALLFQGKKVRMVELINQLLILGKPIIQEPIKEVPIKEIVIFTSANRIDIESNRFNYRVKCEKEINQ